jgi:NitT/TauT family transport system permease protein
MTDPGSLDLEPTSELPPEQRIGLHSASNMRRDANPSGRLHARPLRAALSRRTQVSAGVLTSVGLLVMWELSVRGGLIGSLYFPPPSVIAAALWKMLTEQSFLSDIGVSLYRVWAAFVLSAVMAVPLGILMSSYRLFGASIEPVVDFIRYLPVPALVPLSIIWLGVGEETKLFLLWLGTFFQLILLVADDMQKVPQEYLEVAATVGAQPSQILRDVAFRSMLPSLVNNLRITLGWCWTYLIIAEIVAADNGIGFVIWSARRYMRTPEVMAGVVAIGIIGLLSDQLLRLLHRRAFRYL